MAERDNFLEWLASTRLENGKDDSQEVSPFELEPDGAPTESYDRFYYTLPVALLKLFQKRLDQKSSLFSEICTEIRLATPCRDHSKQVGYWKTSGVRYDGFRLRSTQYTPEHVAMKKWPALKNYGVKRVFVIDEAPATVSRDFKSYLGWLLTNKQFLDEHDELLTRHLEPIRRWGIEYGADMPVAETIYSDPIQNPRNDPKWTNYNSEKQKFLYRWRLGGLAGPYLPTALGSGVNPQTTRDEEREMRQIGSFLFVPDTVAIPSRDELRKILQDARRDLPLAEHIREWQNVIRSESAARNQLQKYGRIFEIQHYWRALFQRHRKTLKGKTGDLENAFATWLKVRTETVHLDLITIRKRLGSDWLDRISPI